MLARLIAFLTRKSAPAPIRPLHPYLVDRQQYGREVARVVGDIRGRASPELLPMFLCDRNGHVREAAVDRAAELGIPMLLPALVPRLNDWVVPVRIKAQRTVLSMLATLDPEQDLHRALQLLPEVQRLRHAGRADHSEWIAAFERRFIEIVGPERIVAAIGDRHAGIARSCFTLARDRALAATAVLCRTALEAKGNVALERNAIDLARGLDENEQREIHRLALASRTGIVRAEALRALLRTGDPESLALAESMLTDGNAWVRMVAGAFLARGDIDVAGRYAEMLSDAWANARTARACLAGLAESGGKVHLALVRGFTDHAHARVQTAAFLAWIHLAPEEKDEIALRVLRSPWPRVRRLSATFINKHGAYVPLDAGLTLMRMHGDHDQMLHFVRGDPWAPLAVIAELAEARRMDPDFQRTLRAELSAWLDSPTRGYRQPCGELRARLLAEATRQALFELAGDSLYMQRTLAHEFEALDRLARAAPRDDRPI